MKRYLFSIFFSIIAFITIAGTTVYFYEGQFFVPKSDKTAFLVAPIKDVPGTIQQYKDDFRVHDVFLMDKNIYKVIGVGNNAFVGSKVKSLKCGDFVETIGVEACSNCLTLESVELNDSLLYIGDEAFYNCKNLKYVKFSPNLKRIGVRAFTLCGIKDTLSLPSSVTEIGYGAFFGTRISCVRLSSNELKIGNNAFAQTRNFVSVDIDNVVSWCNYEFESETANPLYYAKKLTINGEDIVDLNLCSPDIVRIPVGAFRNQQTIKTIRLGQNVREIDSKAFYTSSINTIYVHSVIPPVITDNSFTYISYRLAKLIVPKGTRDLYLTAPGWNSFQTIVEEESLTTGFESKLNDKKYYIIDRNIWSDTSLDLNISTITGKILFQGTTNSYQFEIPGLYIINGEKIRIE